jgi:hypothetical protein
MEKPLHTAMIEQSKAVVKALALAQSLYNNRKSGITQPVISVGITRKDRLSI